ncbi:hypothetical protein [Amycolatopsis sp. lyj-108]|uniref:hypothetical protein n=1 Tax=Amycolatopsis sp. lyj-108 TaxID=2789286 RepID=UPI00397BCF46
MENDGLVIRFTAADVLEHMVALDLASYWASAVPRQANEYRQVLRELIESHALDSVASEIEIRARFGRVLTCGHLLVTAAHQLEVWGRKVASTEPPKPVPMLAKLRNSLTHLDEAVLSLGHARTRLDADGKKAVGAWDIRKLVGGFLPLDVVLSETNAKVFQQVSIAEIEKNAQSWTRYLAAELAKPATEIGRKPI